jgi:uncharacterized protein|uniref:Serine aminopeptidase S33 domain-containing protein n=1 Tax=viral metagenome TaxID=1070528 RepID=A0A6C0IZW6_9ZZZZ
MNIDIVCKIIFTILVVIFIVTTVVKRFCYFKPIEKYKETQEDYTIFKHNHIVGWLLKNKDSDKIVMFCHGYNGNISHRENKYIELFKMGYTVLTFDYSGFGKTSGIPSEQRLYEDASSILSMIKKTYENKNILIYGESMGCPVAIYVARRFNLGLVILESPLISIKGVIDNKHCLLKLVSFLFNDFDIKKYLLGYKGKILLLHSTDDEVVPYDSIFTINNHITKHIPMTGSHKFPNIPWDKIQEFINESN